jgi:hypothetical protein
MIIKSKYNVLNNIWDTISTDHIYPCKLPPRWPNDSKIISIEDVEMWEEIFYQFGNFGLYAAYSPYAPFYIIVHKHFLHDHSSIETFFGLNSEKEIISRMQEFGIKLTLQRSYIEN